MSTTNAARRFAIRGHAASVVEMYAEEVPGWQDDSQIAAVVAAYRAGGCSSLLVSRDLALDVADGLCDLINGEDDMADANSRTNPDLAAMNRAGAKGLRSLRSAILDWANA